MTFQDFNAKENRIMDFIEKGVGDYKGHKAFDVLPKMNRAEMRRQSKKQDTVTMTKKELDNYVERKIKEQMPSIQMTMARFVCVLWCMQLHDYFGFGEQRLSKMTKKIDELMGTVANDYVGWEDLRDQLAEETHVYINLSGKER